jgi:LysR family transcriptional activator of dmlA
VIKERDRPFGVWQLHGKEGEHAIKVTGPLASTTVKSHQWCPDGQGIRYARGGTSGTISPAVIWCICCRNTLSRPTSGRYVSRLATSAKIRTTVEFLRHYFQQHYPQQCVVSRET